MPIKPSCRPLPLIAFCLLASAAVAAADFRLERELALAPGGTFVLDSDGGSIRVRGVDRDGARIVVTADRDDMEERFSFTFEERGANAVVEVEKRGSWTRRLFSSGEGRLRFDVEVPRGAAIDLDTAGGAIDAAGIEGRVELRSSGGRIEIADVTGDVDAHTSGGGIRAADVRGNARLDTSGGPIRARAIDGDLVAETSGGSIEIEQAGGAVKAHTLGGPVRAGFAPGNGRGGTLSSSGGGITATVDPAVAIEVDAHTSGGGVKVELPIEIVGYARRDAVRGTLNGGGPLLKLRSSGGSIRLRGE